MQSVSKLPTIAIYVWSWLVSLHGSQSDMWMHPILSHVFSQVQSITEHAILWIGWYKAYPWSQRLPEGHWQDASTTKLYPSDESSYVWATNPKRAERCGSMFIHNALAGRLPRSLCGINSKSFMEFSMAGQCNPQNWSNYLMTWNIAKTNNWLSSSERILMWTFIIECF